MEFAGEPFYKFMAYERAAETLENAPPVARQLIAIRASCRSCRASAKRSPAAIARDSWRPAVARFATENFRAHLSARRSPTCSQVSRHRHEDGAGPVRRAYGIASVDDLDRALDADGALDGLRPRLGKKSLENIKRGVLAFKGRQHAHCRSGGRCRSHAPLSTYLAEGGQAHESRVRRQRAACGGDGRRRRHRVYVVRNRATVVARFVGNGTARRPCSPRASRRHRYGSTNGSANRSARTCRKTFTAICCSTSTGSREHNIQLRELRGA